MWIIQSLCFFLPFTANHTKEAILLPLGQWILRTSMCSPLDRILTEKERDTPDGRQAH